MGTVLPFPQKEAGGQQQQIGFTRFELNRIVDLYGPTLRLDTPPGRYKVMIGWYSYPSLARLPLADGSADALALGEIEVVGLR